MAVVMAAVVVTRSPAHDCGVESAPQPPTVPAGSDGHQSGPQVPGVRRDIGLRVIAVERAARGLVLLAVGGILAANTHTDWGSRLRGWADDLGLDPSRHVLVARLINRAAALTPHQLLVIGTGAMAYGALELIEGAGLWRGTRWAEYLTVIATAIFVPFEIWELTHRPSLLKAGGLVINLAVVAYLIVMIRRRARAHDARHPSRASAPDA